jgi:hypothetical protein
VNCGRLQHGSPGDQEGFEGFAEVLHEMKAIDDLHRVRCTLANAVRKRGLRSRPITAIEGCWANQAATVAAERSGRRSTTQCVARSTKMVPY